MQINNFAALAMGLILLLLGAAISWMYIELEGPRPMAQPAWNSLEVAEQVQRMDNRLHNLSDQMRLLTSIATVQTPGSLPVRQASNPAISPDVQARLQGIEKSLAELNLAFERFAAQSARPAEAMSVLRNTEHIMETGVLETLLDKGEVDIDLEHLGWTYQQVLDTYGKPTRNGPSPSGGGQKWYYFLEDGSSIIFWFQNNQVSRVLN